MKRCIAILLGCSLPAIVIAAPVHINAYWACTGYLHCGTYDIVVYLLNNLIDGVLYFIEALATTVFFYGALRMIFSRGEEGKEVGKKALIYASLGLVFAVLARETIAFVCVYLYKIGGTAVGACPHLLWPFTP